MKQKSFDVVAISPQPGAITARHRERKMFPSKDFRKPIVRFFGIHPAILIYEPLVVY